ncbi:MAG: hypothetical protein QOJ79_2032 [Actinomycetota bacterium]|jgi:hypothetical protein|nr:hypothetical protein [Actinomycetota bacterium]
MRPPAPGSARIRLDRRIAADPTSTALLLAGPAALDLWPGVRRVGTVDGRVLVEADVAALHRSTAATVRIEPPRRTPTSFVTRFDWVGPSLPRTSGELTLTYTAGEDGPSTAARLVLDSDDLSGNALSQRTLQALADGFLDNLRRLAESRAHAA